MRAHSWSTRRPRRATPFCSIDTSIRSRSRCAWRSGNAHCYTTTPTASRRSTTSTPASTNSSSSPVMSATLLHAPQRSEVLRDDEKLHRSPVKGVGGVVARQPDDATALPFCSPGSEADKVFRPMCGDRSRERKSDHQTSCVKCCQGQPDDNHSDIGPPSQLWDGCGADRQASEQHSTHAQNDPKCREIKRSVEEHQGHETEDFEGWEGPQANQRFGIPDTRNVAMFAPPEPGHGIITTRRYNLIVPSLRPHAEIPTAGLGESRTSSPVRSVMGVCARPSIDSAVAHGDGAKQQTPYSRKMLVTTFGTSTS